MNEKLIQRILKEEGPGDLYKILQVNQQASEEDIKIAFRKLSLLVHPDKNNSNPNATKAFQKVNKAFTILIDPSRRRYYDLSQPQNYSYNYYSDGTYNYSNRTYEFRNNYAHFGSKDSHKRPSSSFHRIIKWLKWKKIFATFTVTLLAYYYFRKSTKEQIIIEESSSPITIHIDDDIDYLFKMAAWCSWTQHDISLQ